MGKRYFVTIVLNVLLIIIITIASTLSIALNIYKFVGYGMFIIVIILMYRLIKFIGKTNKKIIYFFDSVQNNDHTLYYPEKTKDYAFRQLNKGLNRINKLIQEVKLKNQEQEQYLAAILEHIDTGIVIMNKNGAITQANTKAKELLNYKTLTNIVQLKKVDTKLYDTFLELKENSKKLVKINNYDNSSQLSLRATIFSGIKKQLILVSVNDIRSELDEKEIESWIKIIRVMTHEIMNSIAPITSLSETLMGYYSNRDEITEDKIDNTIKGLKIIKDRGVGLIDFVDSYRKLTKIPPPTLKDVNVAGLINRVMLLMELENGFERIEFKSKIYTDNLSIYVDENQITQVLINLIKNAIQALNDTHNPKISIIAQRLINNKTEISVIDNGYGVSQDLMEHIFVPFFTTKDNGGGIGLSLSKQIMRNHKGSIEVYSQPKEFTKFSLLLPS